MRAMLLLIALAAVAFAQDPDEYRNGMVTIAATPDSHAVTQLITAYGYPAENHLVTTADGYILQVQRIPYGRAGPSPGTPQKVIFLQHGLLDSASTWVLSKLGSFAFMLADAGFDVWLGNARGACDLACDLPELAGNTYCQSHVSLNASEPQFWAFSWDQYVIYDLPAKINYVLATTGAANLTYVGHSEGTMTAFALFSNKTNPVVAKINMFIAFAPVAYMHHISVPLLTGAAKLPDFLIWKLLGNLGVLESQQEYVKLLPVLCSVFGAGCEDAICYLSGCENKNNINETRLDVTLAHFPAGTSVQNLIHYAQGVRTEEFCMYNWGSAVANTQHYGQTTPPNWTLASLVPPTMIFYGGLDTLADPTDVQTILNTIPTPVHVDFISDYGHGDFVWGEDAPVRLYAPVIQMLNTEVYKQTK